MSSDLYKDLYKEIYHKESDEISDTSIKIFKECRELIWIFGGIL